jgi:glutaredoxin
MPSLVEIYTKPNCHLCEIAKNELNVLKEEINFTIIEIDISESAELREKYGEYIPVILLNGEVFSRYGVNIEKIRSKIINKN